MSKVKTITHPRALKEFNEILKQGRVDAGYFDNDRYPDGNGLPDIASKNELTRPFMSRAMQELEVKITTEWADKLKKSAYNAEQFFKRMGLLMRGEIVRQIKTSKSWAEKNSDATVEAKTRSGKKGDQPLVDTGFMMNNADFKVYITEVFKIK